MKYVLGKGMNYRLYKRGGQFIFSMPYGGAATQLLNIVLTVGELASYQKLGQEFLDILETDIRTDFSRYTGRHIEINFDSYEFDY